MGYTFAVLSLGCKVNQYEIQALCEELAKRGLTQVPFDQPADAYIVNTCTVTGMSDRKSRQMLRRTKKLNPKSVLTVMGCYSQLSPDAVAAMEETNIVWGTRHREKLPDVIMDALGSNTPVKIRSDMTFERKIDPINISYMSERCRSYIKIEDGCNRYCTYCAIPYARGPVCSRDPQEIVDEAKRLAKDGCREVVLIGINLGVYGRDLEGKPTISHVIKEIAEIPEIARIRIGSMEPDMVNEEFLECLATTPKMCSHFHMALQSGCDNQLRDMHRRYTCQEFDEYCQNLRNVRPDAAICTDIMVGFPGETDADFESTMGFVEKIDFAQMHVFKYSRRPGTKADKMPNQVDEELKNSRSEALISLGNKLSLKFNETLVGKTMEVLVERKCGQDENLWEGHTDNYVTVRFCGGENLSNTLVNVNVTRAETDCVYGTIEIATV